MFVVADCQDKASVDGVASLVWTRSADFVCQAESSALPPADALAITKCHLWQLKVHLASAFVWTTTT